MGGSTGYGGVRRQWSAASVMAARQEGAAAASDGACANLVAVDPAASGADGPADSKGTRQRGSRGGGNGKGKRQRQKLQHRLASAQEQLREAQSFEYVLAKREDADQLRHLPEWWTFDEDNPFTEEQRQEYIRDGANWEPEQRVMFVYFCPCGSTEKVLLAVRVLFYFEPLQAACFNYTFTNPHQRGEKLLTPVSRLLSHAITHTYPEAKGVITVTIARRLTTATTMSITVGSCSVATGEAARQARSCSMTTPMSASHMNLRPVQRVAAAALSLCSFLFCARLAFVLPLARCSWQYCSCGQTYGGSSEVPVGCHPSGRFLPWPVVAVGVAPASSAAAAVALRVRWELGAVDCRCCLSNSTTIWPVLGHHNEAVCLVRAISTPARAVSSALLPHDPSAGITAW